VSLVAALLLASNMLFLVAQRRREIGVLKAIGASAWDIGAMILTEALVLNLAGTMMGFALIRLLATWTLISNHIPLAEIARTTLSDLAVVVGAGASAAALFALVPAWQMARLTSLEVLRNE
jgi:putative ABC transport system permease protein